MLQKNIFDRTIFFLSNVFRIRRVQKFCIPHEEICSVFVVVAGARLVLLVCFGLIWSARLIELVCSDSFGSARLVLLCWFYSVGSARLFGLVWLDRFGSARLVD